MQKILSHYLLDFVGLNSEKEFLEKEKGSKLAISLFYNAKIVSNISKIETNSPCDFSILNCIELVWGSFATSII